MIINAMHGLVGCCSGVSAAMLVVMLLLMMEDTVASVILSVYMIVEMIQSRYICRVCVYGV